MSKSYENQIFFSDGIFEILDDQKHDKSFDIGIEQMNDLYSLLTLRQRQH